MKTHYLIIDTETTMTDKVADFGAIVCDRKGRIQTQAAVLIGEVYSDRNNHPLFHFKGSSFWNADRLESRYSAYDNMVNSGTRMLASAAAVNRWLERVRGEYNPILTAYNLAFDASKCANTGIDLNIFSERFCLWHAAANKWARSKAYRQAILDSVAFNIPTGKGNMSYQTNADTMARYIVGPELEPEPHTALEDIMGYELPILMALVKNTPKKEYMNPPPYNWRDYQVRDHFKPA